ncbi:MAG: hypothetical protein DSM106950_16925 [Stigonema ocellatum SAG 48.90 = DSM 106950]|nr:hypothetical protein [Stigonema ocellatum SAG 48.90 = DSM 106950]
MTPEAKHIVSELRREFYSLFACAMNVPVRITGASYSSNSPIASWIDDRQLLNYLNVYPYIAPDELIPFRPFILRLAINKSAGKVTVVKKDQECRGPNLQWDFELTVLPREILDFLPWIVSLVKADHKGSPSLLQVPPHPFEFKVPTVGLFNQAWTAKAWLLANSTMSHNL